MESEAIKLKSKQNKQYPTRPFPYHSTTLYSPNTARLRCAAWRRFSEAEPAAGPVGGAGGGGARSGLHEAAVCAEKGAEDGPAEHGHRVGADELSHKLQTGGLQDGDDVRPHQVQVLLTELSHLRRRGTDSVTQCRNAW